MHRAADRRRLRNQFLVDRTSETLRNVGSVEVMA
jgi:hypothetical protein